MLKQHYTGLYIGSLRDKVTMAIYVDIVYFHVNSFTRPIVSRCKKKKLIKKANATEFGPVCFSVQCVIGV